MTTGVVLLAGVVLAAAAGCGDSYRRSLSDGFDTGLGVRDADQFRSLMVREFHLPSGDGACVTDAAFEGKQAAAPDAQGVRWYMFSAEELDSAVAACGVDTSDMWRSTD